MNYVKRIRDLREDHDLTQEQIARILGTSQTMYARYERGANESPPCYTLQVLLRECGLYPRALRRADTYRAANKKTA